MYYIKITKLKGAVTSTLMSVMLTIGCLAGCTESDFVWEGIKPVSVSHALNKMDSCNNYLEYAKTTAIQLMTAELERNCRDTIEYLSQGPDERWLTPTANEDSTASGDFEADTGAPGGSKDFSDTNTQEEGVDEADLVKTDGDYIYTISGKDLVIISISETGELAETGRVALSGRAVELYLYKNLIAAFSSVSQDEVPSSLHLPSSSQSTSQYSDAKPEYDGYYSDNSYSVVDVVDISDKTAPALVRTIQFAARYVSSRRIDGTVRAVFSTPINALYVPTWIDVPYWDMPVEQAKRKVKEACNARYEENLRIINKITLDDLLPSMIDSIDGETKELTTCTDIYGPETPAGSGMLTLATLDLENLADKIETLAVIGEEGQVYSSTEALYLTTSSKYVLSARASGLWEEETSGLYKFDISSDPKKTVYRGSGTVEGRLLNQFSLGEYEGYLRVGTTSGSAWWGENSLNNHLTVFKEENGKLVVTGKLSDLGQGEEIYSARFIGTRGFMVTFFTTDPLYTFDLSDPTSPKTVGEWHGPGFSTYMHPFGEDKLITMGRDEYQRTAISLYDLSNFANPVLLERQPLVGENFETSALYEHRAFTLNQSSGLLLLPYFDWSSSTGVLMYQITGNEIDLAGMMNMEGNYSIEGPARRAMYNGDTVIGVGACRITSAKIAEPQNTISSIVTYKDACEFPYWYY